MGAIISISYKGLSYQHSINERPNTERFHLHCHDAYEIYYFICGEGNFIIEGNRYELKKNTMLIIRPNEFHYFQLNHPVRYERYTLHFDVQHLMNFLSDKWLLSPFLDRELGKNNLLVPRKGDGVTELFQRIDACSELPEDEQKTKSQFIIGELLTVILNISRRTENEESYDNVHALVAKVLQYINENISSDFSLNELAAKFFVSKYYLSHVFKKNTGITILEYSLQKKIVLASQMLKSGEKASVTAEACGFGDYASFYRAYKRIMGISPSKTKNSFK